MSDSDMTPDSANVTEAVEPQRNLRGGSALFRRGSIQTKLLLMLLLTSIISSLVVGFFGYRSGTSALRDSSYSRITEVREERARALQDFATSIKGAVLLDSQGVAVNASKDFNAGFDDLADAPAVTGADRAALTKYYSDVFVPNLERNGTGSVDPDAFIPDAPVQSYLQANYTAKFTDFEKGITLDDAGDGSDWTAANKRYNPYFRSAVDELGLDDALLIDKTGDVVYSAYKGVELGSNVSTGEFAGGGLEKVYNEALRSNSRDFVAVADFEQYQPAYNSPTMFIASPVGTAKDLSGVLVYEVSADKINQIMTGGSSATTVQGLGRTGETFLVGPDGTMRSNSRVLLEDPKRFEKLAIDRGTSPEAVERMVRVKNSMLLQPVKSLAAERAGRGQSGTIRTTDYLGEDVLDSYAPVKIPGVDWVIIAKLDADEALAPVNDFARNILLATAAIIVLLSFVAVLLARVFTTPLNRLLTGVRAVAGGELGAKVDAGSKDEFGDLGAAFNDMSTSLLMKQELLDAQQAENQSLLRSLMPDTVVERYKGGETGIADEHQDVTVALTDIEGFDEFAAGSSTTDALALLDALSRGVDEAAKAAGVERVRSSGTSFVVSSGLVVHRVDHVRRAADFAVAVAGVVDRFNSQNGSSLTLRAGLDTGTVRSGLMGDGVVYNLWGEAVNLAYRLRAVSGDPGIFVTDAVKDRLDGAYSFEQAGTVDSGGQQKPVWRLGGGEASR